MTGVGQQALLLQPLLHVLHNMLDLLDGDCPYRSVRNNAACIGIRKRHSNTGGHGE